MNEGRIVLTVAGHLWLSYSLAWQTAKAMVFAGLRDRAKSAIEGSDRMKRWPRAVVTLTYFLSCPECHSFWYGLGLAPSACRLLEWPITVWTVLGLAVGASGFTTFMYRRMIHPHLGT